MFKFQEPGPELQLLFDYGTWNLQSGLQKAIINLVFRIIHECNKNGKYKNKNISIYDDHSIGKLNSHCAENAVRQNFGTGSRLSQTLVLRMSKRGIMVTGICTTEKQ